MSGILDLIQTSLLGVGGSSNGMSLMALGIMLFLVVAFLIIGIPFKYAIMFTSPLVIAFVQIGWFPQIVATIFWLLIVGVGIYLLWTQFSDR